MSASAFGSAPALAIASLPANDSFKRPQRPLGSAAVMAIPAIIGLFRSSVHSSFVKLVLSAINFLLMLSDLLQIEAASAHVFGIGKYRRYAVCLEQTAQTVSGDQARESVSNF